jgi:hypothetical protein
MKGLRSSEGPQIPSAEPTPAFAGSDQPVLYDGFVIKNQGHQAVAERPERGPVKVAGEDHRYVNYLTLRGRQRW